MRSIIIILLILFQFSCNSKKNLPDGFVINGTISGMTKGFVYLERVEAPKPIVVDSMEVSDKGEFELAATTNGYDFFVLRISKTNFAVLLPQIKEDIEIEADAENIQKTLKVKGSKDCELVTLLNNKLIETQARIDTLSRFYEQHKIDSKIQQITDSLNVISTKIISEHQNFLLKFIKENTTSLASLMALFQPLGRERFLSAQDNFETYKLVDSVLMIRYPNSPHVKNLHYEITSFKNRYDDKQINNELLGIGSEAPEISLSDTSGTTVSLKSFRGKYVLVDFWASWCRPCRMENPNLVAAYNKFSKKGFTIFQVSLDKKKSEWEKAIVSDKLNWHHVSDLKYWECEPARVYRVSSIPANFLLDKEGKIIATDLRGNDLEKKLVEIFK